MFRADDAQRMILNIPSLPNLGRLSLKRTHINRRQFRIEPSSTLTSLTRLDCTACEIEANQFLRMLDQSPNLQFISMLHCSTTVPTEDAEVWHTPPKSLRLLELRSENKESLLPLMPLFYRCLPKTLLVTEAPSSFDSISITVKFNQDTDIPCQPPLPQNAKTMSDVVHAILETSNIAVLQLNQINLLLQEEEVPVRVCPHPTTLTNLECYNCCGVTDDWVLAILQNAPCLQSLTVEVASSFKASCFADGSLIGKLPHLKHVKLTHCAVTMDHIRPMLELLSGSHLEYLFVTCDLSSMSGPDFEATVFKPDLFKREQYVLITQPNRQGFTIKRKAPPPFVRRDEAPPPAPEGTKRNVLAVPQPNEQNQVSLPKVWFRSILDMAGSFWSWFVSWFSTNRYTQET